MHLWNSLVKLWLLREVITMTESAKPQGNCNGNKIQRCSGKELKSTMIQHHMKFYDDHHVENPITHWHHINFPENFYMSDGKSVDSSHLKLDDY